MLLQAVRGGSLFLFVKAAMNSWHMYERSNPMQAYLRNVLSELRDGACGLLLGELLQVKTVPDATAGAQAYFPMQHRRQSRIRHMMHPKERTQVLVVLGASHFEQDPVEMLQDQLREAFGHALLYLRDPKAQNERVDAQREWKASCWR
jgi:hypothetical protein